MKCVCRAFNWDFVYQCRGCGEIVPGEMAAKQDSYNQALLRVARAASNIECPNYPEYDWANGSEEYQARRQQLREALKEVEYLL